MKHLKAFNETTDYIHPNDSLEVNEEILEKIYKRMEKRWDAPVRLNKSIGRLDDITFFSNIENDSEIFGWLNIRKNRDFLKSKGLKIEYIPKLLGDYSCYTIYFPEEHPAYKKALKIARKKLNKK
jgi:hypothetical protein